MPTSVATANSGSWQGPKDGFVFSPVNHTILAMTSFAGITVAGLSFGGNFHIISLIDRSTNTRTADFSMWQTFSVTSCDNNVGGLTTVYHGTFPGGGSNAFAGLVFVIGGFTNAGNNGSFKCSASTTTTLTLQNGSGVAETHAAQAVNHPWVMGVEYSADSTHFYAVRHDPGDNVNAWVEKRNLSDGSLVAQSAMSGNISGANLPCVLRVGSSGGTEYVAVSGGNHAGLFVVDSSMNTVINTADISGGVASYGISRMAWDGTGNLWVGGFGGSSLYSDLDTLQVSSAAVSGGTLTVVLNGNVTTTNFSGKFKLSGFTTKTYLNGLTFTGSGTLGSPNIVFTGTGLADDASHSDTGTVRLYVGNDLIKVAIPGGGTTIYNSVWPEDPYAQASNLADIADMMFFDSSDNTMLVGDENRTWRKISVSGTPAQTAVLETQDWSNIVPPAPNNLYQDEFNVYQQSACQNGLTKGAQYAAIFGLGNTTTKVAHNFLLKHTCALADLVDLGQTNAAGGSTINGLFASDANVETSAHWVANTAAWDITDGLLDNTSTNPHSTGMTVWVADFNSAADTGQLQLWQWFDLSLGPAPPAGTITITGTWQYPDGTPVANGVLLMQLSQDTQVISPGGQISGGAIHVVQLDGTGSIPTNSYIYGNDNMTPSGTFYRCTVISPGGAQVWGWEAVSITGASFNFNSSFTEPKPQQAGRP